jgi:hypothetical protein
MIRKKILKLLENLPIMYTMKLEYLLIMALLAWGVYVYLNYKNKVQRIMELKKDKSWKHSKKGLLG